MNNSHSHIIPDINQWPVAQLSKYRQEFISELNNYVLEQILETHKNNLYDLISKTIYMENQRIKLSPWKVDPPDEKEYWKSISADLENTTIREDRYDAEIELIKRIINRFDEEIVGNFKPGAFKFSRIFLTSFFKRIFNKYFGTGQWRWGSKKHLQEKIRLRGNIELIRGLFNKGTVVMMPTHYSNLDSIMIGYGIDSNVGLPSFSYGAGLNLFNVEIVGYFINRLGAFKVDRRKKNPIYLECLKSMASYSIIKGVNCLFFPGGTRSRSGAIEDKLKLGLISSSIEAQRLHLEQERDNKIFVVPLSVGYHFVLEASQLIEQHLQIIGKEKYKRARTTGMSFKTIIRFLKDLYTRSSEVYMSFGDPMDVFGNKVDKDGNSFDKFGNKVNMGDYFTFAGELSTNRQREGVYAKYLGENLVDSYRKFNVILSSNVVSFVAFHTFYKEYKPTDLFQFLNLKTSQYEVSYDLFFENAVLVIDHIKSLAKKEILLLSDESWHNEEKLIREGFEKLGIYHTSDILKKTSNGHLLCKNVRLLYFYQNRLIDYGLEDMMSWKKAWQS
ncbi:MAG: 1-acyl-sn-glycerol-3-phosphate acyltransferase [Saprospiraceae bacterium]|nr:1-acyl-sn-glycerol-3-phosphate acyltransferase [Saprospiraceae bacterium]